MSSQGPWTLDAAVLFVRATERFAERTALIWEEGQMSYATLAERTERLAVALRDMGIGPGDRVALQFPNGPSFIETWWGIVRSGAAAVPLSTRAVPDELASILKDCEPRCVLVPGDLLPSLLQARDVVSLPSLVIVARTASPPPGVLNYDELLRTANGSLPEARFDLREPCAIYYTGGTTGKPKGAVHSHLSVAWGLTMGAQRLLPQEVYLARAPMYQTGGSLMGPFSTLLAGGALLTRGHFTPEELLRTIERHHVIRFYLHPTQFAKAVFQLLDEGRYDLSSVRYLHWTAGPLPDGVREEILRRFPGLSLEVTYGMTEVSNIATYAYHGGSLKPSNCVGYPWPGSDVAVMDDEGCRLPPGQEGEVVVRSPTVMTEYWREPALAARAMEGGWFHTGDLGVTDEDGALMLSGRKKDMIKTGGMAVHAAEVEDVLASHADILEAVVIGLPDERWEEAVTAVVVLHAGRKLSQEEVLLSCRGRLSDYKIPKRVYFAQELPKSAVGKVRKAELIAQYRGWSGDEPSSLWVEAGPVRIHGLKWEGSGSPILLIHGTGLVAALWAPIARRLAKEAGPVYAFDLRGHGRSDKPISGYRWESFAEDLAAVADRLGLRESRVVGHSMGGTVGLVLAAMHPDLVSRLVVIDPVIRRRERLRDITDDPRVPTPEMARQRRSRWESKDHVKKLLRKKRPYSAWTPEVLDLFIEWGTETDGNGEAILACPPNLEAEMYFQRQFLDPWSYLARVSCPLLFVYSGEPKADVMATPEEAARYVPGAELVKYRGGHFYLFEKPDEVAQQIAPFLLREFDSAARAAPAKKA